MIIYKRRLITAAESWYSVPTTTCAADILECLQLESPLQDSRATIFKTIWIDLTKSEEEIFRQINSNTRNRIRRAARDQLRYDFWHANAAGQIDAFCEFYEKHSVQPGSPVTVRRWIEAHARHGTLDFSRITDGDGRVLIWECSYCDQRYARGKYSVLLSRELSPELRPLIGRAHRYQTWEDIKRFKARGLSVYDLGGWYSGDEDSKLLSVNHFKEEFGGQLVTAFHCTRALTIRGRLYMWAADIRARLSRAATHMQNTR